MSRNSLFTNLQLEELIEKVLNGEIITQEVMENLCDEVKVLLMEESNLLVLNAPITLVGDIHGQFHDLIELFRVGGRAPYTNYLFLGDYVDRGYQSIECVALLFIMKIRYPKRINLMRGNHECRQVSQVYGFYEEVIRKFGSAAIWKQIMSVFDYLPITAVIQDTIFCVHGGLSPSIDTIDQIKKINRVVEVPHEGNMANLLWSDPIPDPGWIHSQRGAGYNFGPDVTARFLRTNGLKLVVRAHQMVPEGFQWEHENKLMTLFSAPNYSYRSGNKGAIMEVNDDLSYQVVMFGNAPHRGEQRAGKTSVRPDYFL